jgi:hypothetical protein
MGVDFFSTFHPYNYVNNVADVNLEIVTATAYFLYTYAYTSTM